MGAGALFSEPEALGLCVGSTIIIVLLAELAIKTCTDRRIDRLEAKLNSIHGTTTGAAQSGDRGTHQPRVGDLAPTTSVIVQVSHTSTGPQFVASAENSLGTGPQPALAQGPNAAEVINQVLSKVFPAEMNGQIGSVRLLPGMYPVSAPLIIARSDLTLCGSTGVKLVRAGPASKQARGSTGPLVKIAASNVVVRDLQLDGAVPGTGSPKTGAGASCGVTIEGTVQNVVVSNVSVSNVSATAISAVINASLAPTGGAQNGIVVKGCVIDRCGMGGISLAKRGGGPTAVPSEPVSSESASNGHCAAAHVGSPTIASAGHLVFGNRISRTGSHAVCLTGVSSSQVIANQISHVSLYNEVGVFGHGVAVDGNCGNDAVETVIVTANIIDTVHQPANKRNATCTGIELADGINGAICTSNRVRQVALGYGIYFGGGIAPSSCGVIASNAVEGAEGYGVWLNARGHHSPPKFPNGSSGPTVGCSLVGNCLRDNGPAGVRSDNVSDATIVGNSVSNSDGAAGMMLLGGNRRVAVVANTLGWPQSSSPSAAASIAGAGAGAEKDHSRSISKSQSGVLIQPQAPNNDAAHSYLPSAGAGLVDLCVRSNVAPDSDTVSGQGLKIAGSETTAKDQSRVYTPSAGDSVAVGANLH